MGAERDSQGRFIKGHKFSLGTVGFWRDKKRPDMAAKHTAEGNPSWKGDSVSRGGIHVWLVRTFGTADHCEHCGSISKPRYDYALKAIKQYERKRENFMKLCRSCHQKYDFKHGMRKPTIHTPETIERIKRTRIENANQTR